MPDASADTGSIDTGAPDTGVVGSFQITASGTSTSERGTNLTLSVALSAQPGAEVLIPVTVTDTTEAEPSTATLVIQPETWSSPHLLEVHGLDDAELDGDQPYTVELGPSESDDATFAGLTATSGTLVNSDDELPSVLLTTSSTTVSESGTTATIEVELTVAPTSDVHVHLELDDATEASLETTELVIATGTTGPVSTSVHGVDDSIADGDQVSTLSCSLTTADTRYTGISSLPSLSITTEDDDTPGIVASAVDDRSDESGDPAMVDVRLASQPLADVTLTLISTDTTEGVPTTATLLFHATTWSTPQAVSIVGQDDGERDGDRPYAFGWSAIASDDPRYAGLPAATPVALTNEDDEGAPAISGREVVTLAPSSQSTVSYGGYLNGESFQQDAILTFGGFQYSAYWNAGSRIVMARRPLGEGPWTRVELDPTYTGSSGDAHNTISLGVSPPDGRLHISFDHHGSPLHYVRSVAGLLTDPSVPWATSSFEPRTGSLATTPITDVTYPRFLTLADGRLLFEYRSGASGSGDQVLWEYSDGAWTRIGIYIRGIPADVNAYPHGFAVDGSGVLHVAWCWRDTGDPTTNHDLLYAYSTDVGRTWRNTAGTIVGTSETAPITPMSPGIVAWAIGQNRGLLNQEDMAVDHEGRVHVLLSHLVDSAASDSNFTRARLSTVYFHYWRDLDGTWTRTPIGLPSRDNFRGDLAISSTGHVYAILPNLRIAAASYDSRWTDWELLETAFDGAYFSDPLIDRSRLALEDRLTIFAPRVAALAIVSIDTINYDLR